MQFTRGLCSVVSPAVYREYESLLEIYQDLHVMKDAFKLSLHSKNTRKVNQVIAVDNITARNFTVVFVGNEL